MKSEPVRQRIYQRALASGKRSEHELLLCCSRTYVDEEQEAKISTLLRGEIDWTYLLKYAGRHGVFLMVHRGLSKFSTDPIPDAVRDRLRRGSHKLAAMLQLHIKELHEINRQLEGLGIPVMPFKGPALSAASYGHALRRKPGDLDLLVQRHDFESVRNVLLDRGYHARIPEKEEARYLKTRGSSTFEGDIVNVDLHWTLDQKRFDSVPLSLTLGTEQLWKRRLPVVLKDETVHTLAPEDALLYLCGHGARHNWGALFSVCDVAEVLRSSPDLDWDLVLNEAGRSGMRRILHLGLLLAQGLLDASFPEHVQIAIDDDANAKRLALDVGGWILDPESTARERAHDTSGSFRFHRYHMQLLERPSEKIRYVVNRGLRSLSKSLHRQRKGNKWQ